MVPPKKTKSHRTDTKERHYKDTIRELKAIQRKLVKENSRLKKELHKVDEILLEYEVQEATQILSLPPEEKTSNITCKSCQSSDIVIIKTGIKDIVNCQHCGNRYTRKI